MSDAAHDRADAHRLADAIDRDVRALDRPRTPAIRGVRRAYSARLRAASADHVLAVAHALVCRQRWVAYELLYHHSGGIDALGADDVVRLGAGMAEWGAV
ncbi:MAG TPA: hypothetical protein VK875_13935, partial [Euzebyales bacterium]|nr:hypothetical protein [Euzebyales bacterium]